MTDVTARAVKGKYFYKIRKTWHVLQVVLKDTEVFARCPVLIVVEAHQQEEGEEEGKCRQEVPHVMVVIETQQDTLLVTVARDGRRLQPVGHRLVVWGGRGRMAQVKCSTLL